MIFKFLKIEYNNWFKIIMNVNEKIISYIIIIIMYNFYYLNFFKYIQKYILLFI